MTERVGTVLSRLSSRVKHTDRLSAIASGTVVLAAILRFYRLGDENLWLDEALSITFVTREYTTAGLLFELPLTDPHPPLYYLLLDGWIAIFGTSEVAVRLLSALLGVAVVILIYRLGAKAVDREAGVVAAGLLALSPFHIYYSQEARMYTLLAVLTLLSLYFFVDIVDSVEGNRRRTVLGYVAATVLLGYTHVFGLFVILSQNAYAGLRILLARSRYSGVNTDWSNSMSLVRWGGIQLAVAALLGPWVGVLLVRVFAISAGASTAVSWIAPPTLMDIPGAVSAFLFEFGGYQFSGIWMKLTVLGLLALFAGIALFSRPLGERLGPGPTPAAVLFGLWFLIPLLGAYVVSITVTPIFVKRYLIVASLGLFLLVGAGVSRLGSIGERSVSGGGIDHTRILSGSRYVIIGLVLLVLLLQLPGYYALDQKVRWDGAVTEIESSASPGAAVAITDDKMVAPYRYYADRTDLAITPINDTATDAQIHDQIQGHDEIWVVWVLHSSDEAETVVDYFEQRDEFTISETWEREYSGLRMYKVVKT